MFRSLFLRYNETVTAPLRLTPTMVSRKLIALDFIKRYFAEWGASPSLDEIAASLSVSKQRANELVRQLSTEAQIRHTKGKHRGIELVEPGAAMSQAEALLRLRELGWRVHNDVKAVDPPLTNIELPNLPLLDHDPARDIGVGISDGDAAG